MIKKLNAGYLIAIMVGSAIVVFAQYICQVIFYEQLSPYLLILMVFVLYDGGDTFIHYREFKDLSVDLWSKKAAIRTFLFASARISGQVQQITVKSVVHNVVINK